MFFNMGMAEIAVIAIIGLLVFGPDRLPKAVKTLVTGARQLRGAATDATRSMQEAAGWDSAETRQTMEDLANLHPKRLMGSILEDTAANKSSNGASDGKPRTGTAPKPAVSDFDPDAP